MSAPVPVSQGRGPGVPSTGTLLVDIHVHPSLKDLLLGVGESTPWPARLGGRGVFNPFRRRAGFGELLAGGVSVAFSSLYPPERALFDQWHFLERLVRRYSPYRDRVLADTPWRTLLLMMELEAEALAHQAGIVQEVSTPGELEAALARGRLAVVRTVEGAHVLEGRLRRVDRLAELGVASLTLAHLYPNETGGSVNAVPGHGLVRYGGLQGGGGPDALTDFGEAVVERMMDLGMLVDLAHAPPGMRADVLDVVDGRAPVLASHVGLRHFRDHPYNLGDEEVLRIAETGGLVGVILAPEWHGGGGLDGVADTVMRVAALTGGFDHVAVGSDLDGFTRPAGRISRGRHLWRLEPLLRERGLEPDAVDGVLGRNALRVLRDGWRRSVQRPAARTGAYLRRRLAEMAAGPPGRDRPSDAVA